LAGKQYKVEEGTLLLNEVPGCTEAFITSTTKGVLPVSSIDGYHIPKGPVTKFLQDALHQEIMVLAKKNE